MFICNIFKLKSLFVHRVSCNIRWPFLNRICHLSTFVSVTFLFQKRARALTFSLFRTSNWRILQHNVFFFSFFFFPSSFDPCLSISLISEEKSNKINIERECPMLFLSTNVHIVLATAAADCGCPFAQFAGIDKNMYMNESSPDKISCWPAFKQSVYNWNCYYFTVLLRRFCFYFTVFFLLSKFPRSFVLSFFWFFFQFLFIQNIFFCKNICTIYMHYCDRFINRFEPACIQYKHIAYFNYSKDRTSWMWLISRKGKKKNISSSSSQFRHSVKSLLLSTRYIVHRYLPSTQLLLLLFYNKSNVYGIILSLRRYDSDLIQSPST